MKTRNVWWASLGLAVLCLSGSGCGGKGNDAASTAAAPEAAPAPAPADEPAAVAEADPAAKADPAAAEKSEPAGEAAAKPEGGSGTAEMLALGTAPATAPSAPADPNAPAGATPATPDPNAPAAAAATPAPAPAAEEKPGAAQVDLAAPGAAASDSTVFTVSEDVDLDPKNPNDFRSPYGAVIAFLKALKAKDPQKLQEATALRSQFEATGKNQKLFTSILEQSLTEDELTELANKLEGFRIVGQNEPKSTARLGIILAKPAANGAIYRRTITARHEKAGWKVVDISGQGTIEKPIMIPLMGGGRGGMQHHGGRR